MKIKLTLLLIFIFSMRLDAQSTFIDSSFATDGAYVLDYFGFGHVDQGGKSLIQADGKIIVGGNVWSGVMTNDDIYLMRLNTDGTLDNTFGNNGELLIDFNDDEILADMAFTANEDIIVYAAKGMSPAYQPILCKVNNNGTLDHTFGNNGYVEITSGLAIPAGVGLQSDGKIITLCNVGFIQTTDIQMARFHPNGTIDNTFGTNGKVIENFGATTVSAYKLFVDHTDFIVIGVSQDNSFSTISKFESDGNIDTTFANHGIYTVSTSPLYRITKIALDNASKHYIIGLFEVSFSDSNYELMQLQLTGQVDSSFGNNGYLVLDFGGNDRLSDFEYDTNNNLILCGRSNDTSSYYHLLTSIDETGTIDTTFGDNGIIKVNFEKNEHFGNMNLQSDGKILLTGSTLQSANQDIFIGRIFRDLLSNSKPQIEQFKNLSIFPNPTNGQVTILLDDAINQDVLVQIFDLNGRQVLMENLSMENGKTLLSFQKTLSNGQYILRVKGENFVVVEKLIFMKY